MTLTEHHEEYPTKTLVCRTEFSV